MSSSTRSFAITNGTDTATIPLGGQLLIPGAIIDPNGGTVTLGVAPQLFGAFTLDAGDLTTVMLSIGQTAPISFVDEVIVGFAPLGPRINAVADTFVIDRDGYYLVDLNVLSTSIVSTSVDFNVRLRSGGSTIAITKPGIISFAVFGGTRYRFSGLVYLPPGTYTVDARSPLSLVIGGATVTGTLRITAEVL